MRMFFWSIPFHAVTFAQSSVELGLCVTA